MICTIFSFVLAILLFLLPSGPGTPHLANLSPLFLIAGSLFVLTFVLMQSFLMVPLQKAERHDIPRIVEIYKKDKLNIYTLFFLLCFSLLNFAYLYNPLILQDNEKFSFAIWIFLMGISLDFTSSFFRRTLAYLDPFFVVKMITQEAKRNIFAERDLELSQWIDTLTEIGKKAIERNSLALCNEAINQIQLITKTFMESCKSISHLGPITRAEGQKTENNEQALGRDADEVSFLLFYISQRLEFIFDKALKNDLEPQCDAVISAFGKITLYAAKFDLSLASYPIHFIGKLARRAQDRGFQEIADKATFTLLEVAKTILSEIDFTYLDLKDPFLAVLTHLDEIAKETFRKDKSVSIAVIIQPIRGLRELFSTEKLAAHQDTSVILGNINRVLGEYEALEQVLKTMPPINKVTESVLGSGN